MTNTELLNKIGSTVTEAGKEGLEKAKELRDTAVISLEIRDREASIRKAYRELGRAYFQDHRNDEEPVYDQIVFIKAAFEEIGELKATKDDIRGIRRCPECGEAILSGAHFCPNCGKRYEEPEDEDDEEVAEPEEEPVAKEEKAEKEPAKEPEEKPAKEAKSTAKKK